MQSAFYLADNKTPFLVRHPPELHQEEVWLRSVGRSLSGNTREAAFTDQFTLSTSPARKCAALQPFEKGLFSSSRVIVDGAPDPLHDRGPTDDLKGTFDFLYSSNPDCCHTSNEATMVPSGSQSCTFFASRSLGDSGTYLSVSVLLLHCIAFIERVCWQFGGCANKERIRCCGHSR